MQEGEIPYNPELEKFEKEERIILRYAGHIDPDEIRDYIALGGNEALDKALSMKRGEIIEEVKRSGLRGLGGAGFPVGMKWEACFKAEEYPKYVICNGDEGDPGAFMDRVILESSPHQVIEGMAIAGHALGSHQGFIYIRSEYPLAIERLEKAIDAAREYGLLGESIFDTDFSFDISIFRGAGAFVCGETTRSGMAFAPCKTRILRKLDLPHSNGPSLSGMVKRFSIK